MKKLWLALAGMVLAFSASAAQFGMANNTSLWKSLLRVNRKCWSSSPSTARTAISLKKFFTYLIT